MTETLSLQKNRIESIDSLRGLVMVIMALDHVRDFIHSEAFTGDPLDIEQYNLALYFTRWVTHFCAPIFVFLSGISIYLQSFHKSKKELGLFIVKRGLWLIFMEWTLIAFAWTFNPTFPIFPFQVIWAIGISMVLLGVLLLLKAGYRSLFIIGIVIVVGHNVLDYFEKSPAFKANFFWDLLHSGTWKTYTVWGNHVALIIYPFIAWTGLMLLGYCCGTWFEKNVLPEKRVKYLKRLGFLLLLVFLILRFSNIYGDPFLWSKQNTLIQTILSFINVHKYPPSLLFLLLTIGVGLLALAYLEKVKNSFTQVMKTFGRTAFFYYLLHFYIIHLIAVALYFVHGHSMAELMEYGKNFSFLFVVPGQGESLGVVYFIWLAVVVMLYPLCKWYDQYKTSNKGKWWLSYL